MAKSNPYEFPWHKKMPNTGKTLREITLELIKTNDSARSVCDFIRLEYGYDIPEHRIIDRARCWGYKFGKSKEEISDRRATIAEEMLNNAQSKNYALAPENHIQDIMEEIKTMSRITAYFRQMQYESQYHIMLRITRRLQGLLPNDEQEKLTSYIAPLKNERRHI